MGTVYAIKNRFALGGVRLFDGRSKICRAVPFHGIEERRRTNQSECRRSKRSPCHVAACRSGDAGRETLQCVVATSAVLLKASASDKRIINLSMNARRG